jgi:hypothetical protein
VPVDQAGLGEELQMPRDAGLGLAEDVGEVRDGQLALHEQRENLQSRLLRRGPKAGESLVEAERRGRLR